VGTLQPRERRLLMLAGLVALGVLGYWFVVEPLVARRERTRELLQAREAIIAKQDRLLARQGRYAEEERTFRAEIEQRRARLLPGDKAPLAASELQKLVKTTAQDTGVEVRSERTLPTTERGGYTEVPVEVTLSGPIRGLVSFLHRLEAAPVLLAIQDVKLRVASIGSPREILATLALAGYIATGTDAAGTARPEAPRRTGT
jgi:type II secretory pathway component PulM